MAAAQAPATGLSAEKKKLRDPPPMLSKKGVLYFGHMPGGFYEKQLRGFLAQFGAVAKVRLSRSRRTGGYKGFGFVQFVDPNVADVVQKTMHGYILMGRTLVCQHVAPEVGWLAGCECGRGPGLTRAWWRRVQHVHDRMFVGALTAQSKRVPFRTIDWRRLALKQQNEGEPSADTVKRRLKRLRECARCGRGVGTDVRGRQSGRRAARKAQGQGHRL
jgi:RNA recognition motif-containing protein